MDGKLVLFRSGAGRQPWGGTNWNRLIEASYKGREEGRVLQGRGGRVNPKECDPPVGVDFDNKREGEGTVGGRENLSCDVWKGGRNSVTVRVRGVCLSRREEPSCGSREREEFGGGGGGGRGGKGSHPFGGDLWDFFLEEVEGTCTYGQCGQRGSRCPGTNLAMRE